MYYHTVLAGFLAYFVLLFQLSSPVELELVDEGVEDRGALSASMKVLPLDLLPDQSFERLYKVVGYEDIYVRRAGGLRAIFRSSKYVDSESGEIALIPAGTVYCIGEVTPRVLQQLGVLIDPPDLPQEFIPSTPKNQREVIHQRYMESTRTIRFLDDELYRRKRLASFVLVVALATDQPSH